MTCSTIGIKKFFSFNWICLLLLQVQLQLLLELVLQQLLELLEVNENDSIAAKLKIKFLEIELGLPTFFIL